MKTLALNIIVGAGEADLLERALISAMPFGFDEIVICMTAEDNAVALVAEKYASKIAFFPWCNDFAAARNACLDATESTYVMWMDADDIWPEKTQRIAYYVKQKILESNLPYYFGTYDLEFDENQKSVRQLPRIIAFCNDARIEWKYPIHEILSFDPSMKQYGLLEDVHIEHRPRTGKNSCSRNLSILADYIAKNDDDDRMVFYLAKEMYISEETREDAVTMYKNFIRLHRGSVEERAYACLQVAQFYAYDTTTSGQELKARTLPLAENYAHITLGLCPELAEAHIILGDIQEYRGNLGAAIEYYKKALHCKLSTSVEQDARYYTFIPSDRLSAICYSMGNYVSALLYNAKAYEASKEIRVLRNRQYILDSIQDELSAAILAVEGAIYV